MVVLWKTVECATKPLWKRKFYVTISCRRGWGGPNEVRLASNFRTIRKILQFWAWKRAFNIFFLISKISLSNLWDQVYYNSFESRKRIVILGAYQWHSRWHLLWLGHRRWIWPTLKKRTMIFDNGRYCFYFYHRRALASTPGFFWCSKAFSKASSFNSPD